MGSVVVVAVVVGVVVGESDELAGSGSSVTAFVPLPPSLPPHAINGTASQPSHTAIPRSNTPRTLAPKHPECRHGRRRRLSSRRMSRVPRSAPLLNTVPSRRRALAGLGACLLLGAAACAPAVHAERVGEYPLEAKKTYAWITEDPVLIQFGEAQPNVRTPQNEANLRAAIDASLGGRGFTKVARDEAELLVAFSVGTTMRYRIEGQTTGNSIGGLEPGTKQTKGTLNVYLVDRAQMKEVWHGWTSKWLSNAEDPKKVAADAVEKIMATYPGAK